ncbi:MAG: hypothetical protein QHH80_12880 [Anaerolineae bacterium]|nr:hypothetical protein [Anaerolineae bacterium]
MERHLSVLRMLYDVLEGAGVNWAVTGSLGLALQGVPLEPHDVDVQTDEAGAYRIAALFADRVVRPVTFSAKAGMRSHFGALDIDGLTVEVMGDVQHQRADGSWEPPPDLWRIRRWVDIAGIRVPVLSLEHERDAYAKMGRTERVALISRALEAQGSVR